MDPQKEALAQELAHGVQIICQNTLSAEGVDPRQLLGLSATSLLKKVSNALPPAIFDLPILTQQKIKEYIIKEFILFQCQEDETNEFYLNNFTNFIYELLATLTTQFNVSASATEVGGADDQNN